MPARVRPGGPLPFSHPPRGLLNVSSYGSRALSCGRRNPRVSPYGPMASVALRLRGVPFFLPPFAGNEYPVPGELLLYNHIIIIDSLLQYWEKAEFPLNAIPKLPGLGVAGGTAKGYGCPGLSITASGVTRAEMARVDASCSTFILVHSSLAMVTIALCGFEAHKQKYFPSLAELTTVGCWGATTTSEFSYNSIYLCSIDLY